MLYRKSGKITAVVLAVCLIFTMFAAFAAADAYDAGNYTLTGDGAQDMIGVAKTQLGYAEGSSGYTKYGEYFGNSAMDWCCAFVSWCAVTARVNGTVFPRNVSCTSMKNAFAAMGRYYTSAHYGGSYTPVAGDLVFFSYTYSTSDITHIGLVTSTGNSKVYTVEGNYSDKVASATYALSSAKIVGYANPEYNKKTDGYPTGTYITSDAMNFRTGPGTEYKKIDLIPNNTTVVVTEVNGEWGKTTYNGKTGWFDLYWSSHIDLSPRGDGTNWLIADISQWNAPENFDWTTLAASGVKGVILRVGGRYYGASKSIYYDSAFVQHYKAAKAAGLKVGVYFFSYALSYDGAVEEANCTIDVLRKNDCQLDLPVFIDIENAGSAGEVDYQHSAAGKDTCSTVVDAFCDTIETAGYYAGIYCSKSFAEDLIADYAMVGRAIWIAHYGVTQCGYTERYDMWQYTDSGNIPGYNGKIDLSYCYTDLSAAVENLKISSYNPYGSHTPSDWQTAVSPTCSTEGQSQVVCTKCQKVLDTRVLEKTDHKKSGNYLYLLDTSLKVGDKVSDTVLSRSHSENADKDAYSLYYETYKQQGGTIFTYCVDCKTVISTAYAYADCSHPGKSVVLSSTPSTCITQGVTMSSCSACNRTVYAKLMSLTEHTPGETATCTKSDCTQEGSNVISCTVCNQPVSSVFADATEHSYSDWQTVTAVSCVQNGKYTAVCVKCAKVCTRTVTAPFYGDTDLDGEITIADARLALRHSVGLEDLDEAAVVAADVDKSGAVSPSNARQILRFVVGIDNVNEMFVAYYGEAAKDFIKEE